MCPQLARADALAGDTAVQVRLRGQGRGVGRAHGGLPRHLHCRLLQHTQPVPQRRDVLWHDRLSRSGCDDAAGASCVAPRSEVIRAIMLEDSPYMLHGLWTALQPGPDGGMLLLHSLLLSLLSPVLRPCLCPCLCLCSVVLSFSSVSLPVSLPPLVGAQANSSVYV